VEIQTRLLQVARDAQDITARSRALQEVTEADVLQASIEAQQADVSLFQARNRYRAAWFQLVTVVGRPDLPHAPLTGDVRSDLPDIRWDDGLQQLLSLSPELAQSRARLEQARCNLAWQVALGRPNVTLYVGVKHDEAVRDVLTDAVMALPLQLFDRNQGNILSARADLAAALREVERVELDLRNRFVTAFEQYSNARYEVDVYRTSLLKKAQQSLDLIAIGYREGEFSYLSLLTAQRTYFSANLEYLASLQRLWTQAVSLDGFLLGAEPAE
jgi:cobalt-zinc-cadmium efflux system outer membrane protein